MAVQDPQAPPPGQQPPLHPIAQKLITAAQTGAVVRATGAATVAPSVAVAAPAVAAGKIVSTGAEGLADALKVALVLRVLRRLLRRSHTETVSGLEAMLRERFPDLDPAVIRRIVETEARYELAFGRKATRRVDADLQKVGLLDKEAQKRRIAEVIARERHYVGLRQKASLARAIGHAENETVRQASPEGARWVLGPAAQHTPGCVAMAGKVWPWSVLDTIPLPPIHPNCGCRLVPLGPNDTVPPVGEAMAAARRAMALEEAITAVADVGEVSAFLAGEAIRPSVARAICELREIGYQEAEHPRGRGGRWMAKLGAKRIELKGDKKLTLRQTHSAVKRVAEGLVDFYGGDKKAVEAHHEPQYMADVGGVARFRHPGELLAGINYGDKVMDTVRDPEYGTHDLRIVAHEAAHSLSGTRPGPLPGFSQTFEEGGAEILSLWFWHHRAQPLDHRDATRLSGKWTKPGADTLAHSVVYRKYVEETMRRAASKVGWDRTALIDEVERVMRGDHTVRLHFRDETDPKFPLPKDLPDMPRAIGNEDDTDHAVPLVRWLIADSAKLTSGANDDRSREAKGGGPAGSVGGRGRDLVGFGEVDVQTPAGRERYLAGLQANPQAGFISDPGEELAGKRAFLSADGNVGVTISGSGEVGNLFRNEGAPPGSGGAAVDHAVANGGTWLNAFDGALPKIYAKHGFVEVARLKWDPGQEPDAWNHERYDAPDVVFMRHGGVANPGNYVQTWDDAEALVTGKLQEAFDESLHPRDRTGRWSFLGRLHTLTRSDIEAGHVPGVQVAGLASGVAGHAGLGGRPITLAPSGFDKQGRVSSVLLAHEAGHHLVNTVIKDGKVPPEMEALRAGVGRAAGRYGAYAGNAHLFENPWKAGERDLPEEMIADGYADLLHGGAEFRYDGPPEPEKGTREHEWWAEDVAKDRAAFEETPKVKLLKVIAAAARENGMPDHALYTFEFTGPMSHREATLVLREADLQESFFDAVLHPRGRRGQWVEAINHAERDTASPERDIEQLGFTGEDFAKALSGFSHGGITAMRGNRTDTQNLYGDVWLNLHKPGGAASVGLVRVTLKPPDHRGERTAVIENVFLRESEQNHGFGRAFTDHLFKTLRDGGVDRIALEAISVGGYSWARRGFVWDGDHAAEQRRILQDAKNDGRWDRIKDWPGADELERKLLAGEFSSEAELAAYGQSRWTEVAQPQDQMTGYTQPERERTRLGKELLIGSRWKGSRPVVVAAGALQEALVYDELLHPRDRTGRWMFHLAPKGARADIEKNGIDSTKGMPIVGRTPLKSRGNYLWDRPEAVQQMYAPSLHDIWAVDTKGLDLDLKPDPEGIGAAVVTQQKIPPGKVRRVEPAELEAIVNKLQEARLLQERAEETHLAWDPIKHRRGWHGHFADMLKELPKPSLRGRGGGTISIPDGHHVARARHGYDVTRPSGSTLHYDTAEEAAKSVHDEYESARLEAEVKAERAASRRERMEREQRKREEEIAEASKHPWYRFESPEIAHKLVADAAEGKGELWGLPGYQNRGNAAVRAQPRRPSDETIKHERANGRVLIEFHTKVTPDAGLDDNQPQHEWTPTASVQNRNAQRLGLQDLRLEEEKETKYGRSEVAKLRIHGVRIIDVGG